MPAGWDSSSTHVPNLGTCGTEVRCDPWKKLLMENSDFYLFLLLMVQAKPLVQQWMV
jgi:hypothetical protein